MLDRQCGSALRLLKLEQVVDFALAEDLELDESLTEPQVRMTELKGERVAGLADRDAAFFDAEPGEGGGVGSEWQIHRRNDAGFL